MTTLAETGVTALAELQAALAARACFLVLQDHESRLSAWVSESTQGAFDPSVCLADVPSPQAEMITPWLAEMQTRRVSAKQTSQQQTCIALPLIYQLRHLGSIYVITDAPIADELVERAQHYSCELAPQISHYIPSRTQYREIADDGSAYSISLLIALHNLNVALASQHNEMDAIHMAVNRARRALDIDRLAVFLIDGTQVFGTWGTSPTGELVNEQFYQGNWLSHPLDDEAIRRKDHVVVRENSVLGYNGQAMGVGWNAMVALWHQNQAIGWLAVDNLIHQRPLLAVQREAIKLLGAALAQNIIRIRQERSLIEINQDLEDKVAQRTAELEAANSQLAKLTRTDPLTTLNNRRYLDKKLSQEWARHMRQQRSLAIIMIDVDHFKDFNDHFGHVAGDQCLQQIAEVLARHSQRAGDMAARYGGEEFALLLPETPLEAAEHVADSVRQQIEALNIDHAPTHTVVTASLGVAALIPDANSQAEWLIKRADEALYLSKDAGRNCVTIA